MFNGIIYNQGILTKIVKTKKGCDIFLKSDIKIKKSKIGISVSCDGVCLTLISVKKNIIQFYLSNETLLRSNFKRKKVGDKINLELPLKNGQDISGHICQGHVDTIAMIKNVKNVEKSQVFEFALSQKFKTFLIEKASILINGVSLTISKITKTGFNIWVIPHTLKLTNLSNIKKNDIVNVEIDILSKYVRKYINESK